MIIVKKLKIVIREKEKVVRDSKYQFVRDAQYAQYRALNIGMGYLASTYLKCDKDFKSEEFKAAKRNIKRSNPIFSDIEFAKGVDTPSMVNQKVVKHFNASVKNGLATGDSSVVSYRRTYPLMTRGRDLKFRYEDDKIIIKWVNKIEFEVILGSGCFSENVFELRHTLHKVVNGEYKVSESSLYFDKNDNLMLNLSLNFELNTSFKPVVGRVLGVDLGIKTPAHIALSDKPFVHVGLGDIEQFLNIRTQMENRRRALQKSLTLTKGGKGRQKKLKALSLLKDKERNFAKTYNHKLSHKIVQFAKNNNCEAIHLEKLTKDGFDKRLLRYWSYYELQSMIEYKANIEGIKVFYVDPSYTSQKCYNCGHIGEENRVSQSTFKCVKCSVKLNADHNAAINISRKEVLVS